MSSGVKVDSSAAKKVGGAIASRMLNEKIARLGMSPRQQLLNHMWARYTCTMYDACKVDWSGREVTDSLVADTIATQGFLPQGYYYSGNGFPLKYRKPSAPYNLVKVIVDRFTGLLFSERRSPKLRVEGDPDTESYVAALAEASRLWPQMIEARKYGGATGTAVIGFQIVDGVPIVEVHDPRWCFPDFVDRHTLTLRRLEKRYMYPVEEQDPETGAWVPVWYWYRRVVDMNSDTLWKPILVADGEEPDWDNPLSVQNQVKHNLGECPMVWIQNIPVQDDIDGEPDCWGIYDTVHAIDMLLAQADRGTLKNCDPTMHVSTDDKLAEVAKGSDNAIKTEKGGSAGYIEITGSGPKAARELAAELRAYALEVAQCVLDHPDTAQRTATEIDKVYSSMLARADVFREQYGERGVKPLLAKMVRAVRKLGQPRANGNGQLVVGTLNLPMRQQPDGTLAPQKLGNGQATVSIKWPNYFEPSLDDINKATMSAAMALTQGLVDREHAVNFVAEYYRVEDVKAMLQKIQSEQKQQQQQADQQMMARLQNQENFG